MNVAVVNLFDPMPGDPIREGRYGALSRALVERGHRVHWYSGDFFHATKSPREATAVEEAARRVGYAATLVPSQPYATNVSLSRLASHRLTAMRLDELWRSTAERPEAIVVSLPPPAVGRAAADWARRTGAALVVDVQDLWPETFGRFWPRGFGWLNRLAFAGMVRDARAAYGQASAVVGAARGYVEHAAPWVRPGTPTAVLHLGVDLAEFDAAAGHPEKLGLTKGPGEKWLLLGGTLSAYVDWPAALDLMEELGRRRRDVRLLVVGSGPDEARMRREAARRGLDRVTFLGQQPYEVFALATGASDVGLVLIRSGAFVFFPNRVFDYFAAGLPVLSNIGGELEGILEEHRAGVTSILSGGAALADAAEGLLAARAAAGPDYRARRGEWVRTYDRSRIAAALVGLIEQVAQGLIDGQ